MSNGYVTAGERVTQAFVGFLYTATDWPKVPMSRYSWPLSCIGFANGMNVSSPLNKPTRSAPRCSAHTSTASELMNWLRTHLSPMESRLASITCQCDGTRYSRNENTTLPPGLSARIASFRYE